MFKLKRTEYDRRARRAYLEFRAPDADGDEAIAVVVFSYKTVEAHTKARIREEVVRKARHILKGAIAAT